MAAKLGRVLREIRFEVRPAARLVPDAVAAGRRATEAGGVERPGLQQIWDVDLAHEPLVVVAQLGTRSRGDLVRHSLFSHSPAAPSTCICRARSEEHTSELQSRQHVVCRLSLENTIAVP